MFYYTFLTWAEKKRPSTSSYISVFSIKMILSSSIYNYLLVDYTLHQPQDTIKKYSRFHSNHYGFFPLYFAYMSLKLLFYKIYSFWSCYWYKLLSGLNYPWIHFSSARLIKPRWVYKSLTLLLLLFMGQKLIKSIL